MVKGVHLSGKSSGDVWMCLFVYEHMCVCVCVCLVEWHHVDWKAKLESGLVNF